MAGENVGCNSFFPENASGSCSSESEYFLRSFSFSRSRSRSSLPRSPRACTREKAGGRLGSSEGGVYSRGLLEEEGCNEESDGGVYSCTFFLEEERRCDESFGGICSWGFLFDEG